MSRLTLRLPETLHQQLANLAEGEGISLNQYIVYALTKQVTLTYSIQSASEEAITAQKHSFTALRHKLGQVSPAEIELILAEREKIAPEAELSSEAIDRLQQRIRERTTM
ncbi:MAG: toxin-antitoxin system HicB family antitoxin [Nostocaceae cyanobacterium]|nr:toxin-antitoxin system HicB family antitoxin [Nostocaceae cyanobacterium]